MKKGSLRRFCYITIAFFAVSNNMFIKFVFFENWTPKVLTVAVKKI